MNAYKFLVKDIYTNEKREFEYSSPNKDPRLVHKEGLKKIKYEEDRVDESVCRKGYTIDRGEIVKTIAHFLKDKIKICPHCYNGLGG